MNTHIVDQSALVADFAVTYRYEIHFTRDLFGLENALIRDFFSTQDILENQRPKALFMIDQGILDHYPDISSRIRDYFESIPVIELVSEIIALPGGEPSKNDRKAQARMLKAIDTYGIDRHSYVIAIGGGAVLDAVGYASAISHRGVRHIRIPTTVLSQNDSGIGVKNGINYFGKKNYLGSFTPPVAVWNDLDFLRTLEDRDKRSGLAEAVKVALIRDESFFRWLEQHSLELKEFEEQAMQQSIIECARLHLHHITTSGDPFERGSARPLDFGHWVAHKLEYLSDYKIRHGEAVAVGIALDSVYSHMMGYIDKDSMNRILHLISQLGFSSFYEYLARFESNLLLEGLEEFREHLGGRLTVTLLEKIGKGFEVHSIDTATMKAALQYVIGKNAYNEN